MKTGQGLWLELDYADGGMHNKQRPFLIIDVNDKYIQMLNVSSSEGKEYKLAFKSNQNVKYYKPPFWKKSFVKLDGLYVLENDNRLNDFIVTDHRRMNPEQLMRIKTQFTNYRNNGGKVNDITISMERVLELNQQSAIIQNAYTIED